MPLQMDLDTLRLLRAVDAAHVGCCDPPEGFDWVAEMAQVQQLAPVVERIVGRPFVVDPGVQDATYFTELGTYHEAVGARGYVQRDAVLAIRFSSFGRLFTVWWSVDTPPAPAIVSAVIDAVRERGYFYVESAMLNSAYSGADEQFRGGTWWIRFFDYY